MPEATYILLDCSSFARNGDFRGTRWGVTKEVVDLICDCKTRSNVENSVALVSMKYSGAEICLHLTDQPRWTGAMQELRLSHGRGQINIDLAVRKARLALKHRRNDKQTKRIIVIVCSPVHTEAKPLIKCAKELKKNGYYLDIICFGIPEEEETNTVKKLQDMVKACDKDNDGHFLHLPDNKSSLRDMVASSPIIGGVGGGFGVEQPMQAMNDGAPAAPVPGFEGLDFDPSADPELAMAIRASLEHQRNALAEAEQQQMDQVMTESTAASGGNAQNNTEDVVMEEAPAAQPEAPVESSPATDEKAVEEPAAEEEDDEDEEMRRALALSMENDEEDEDDEDLYDDEELQKALAMSMEMDNDEPAKPAAKESAAEAEEENAEDHEFLANLLSELPGVAVDDIDFEEIMQTLNDGEEDGQKDKDPKNPPGGTN